MDQIKVSEEALSYKRQFLADFADMSSTIQNKCKYVLATQFIYVKNKIL